MNPDAGGLADHMRSMTAVGRYRQLREIANAAAYLALPEAGFVTGVT
jgi:3-oxoacyl-[acyl-carrier protein] reductase